ncbi:hypothetical protein VPH35_033053 [Triticum aestivum]
MNRVTNLLGVWRDTTTTTTTTSLSESCGSLYNFLLPRSRRPVRQPDDCDAAFTNAISERRLHCPERVLVVMYGDGDQLPRHLNAPYSISDDGPSPPANTASTPIDGGAAPAAALAPSPDPLAPSTLLTLETIQGPPRHLDGDTYSISDDGSSPSANTTSTSIDGGAAPAPAPARSPDPNAPSNLETMLHDESSRPHHILLQVLKETTDNFFIERILGQGGFSVVYKGVLPNGEMIAVKRIASSLIPGQQKQFEREVYHLMVLKHPNIVRCVGYCYETHNAFGYMAPEFLNGGKITPKSDIFSLGVIILEVVTGHRDYPDVTRTPSDEFIELTLRKWRNVLQKSLGYGSLETNYEQIKRCIQIGLMCVNPNRSNRLPIMKVIHMLQGLESISCDISNETTT